MIVVDSSVWIDFFNGVDSKEVKLLDYFLSRRFVLIGDIILTEVLQGFRNKKDFNTARKLMESLSFEPMWGKEVALAAAENFRFLKSKGITVRKTIDIVIATFCIVNRHELLCADKDFDPLRKHCKLRYANL